LGIVCFGTLACCLAIENVFLRVALISLNAFVILQTGGRSCLIASAITISVYIILTVSIQRSRFVKFAFVAALLILVCVGAIYANEIAGLTSTLLFLNDPNRGLGSGFTGRMDAWQEAYQLFLKNPILGIGFRTHERYITTLPSAHNGYVSVLAETGILGVSSILLLIGFCSWRVLKMAKTGDQTARIGVSFVAGYLFVSMFERILVNFGSPTSVLMWVFLLMPRWPRPGAESRLAYDAEPKVYSLALANS
jgi:O-antigen ligase